MTKLNPRGLYWADPQLLAAKSMHESDRQLRRASASGDMQAWFQAGVDFIRFALRHNCLDRLNEVAEIHGGNTRLGERSLDELFESGQDTELFIQRLRREAEADPVFGAQMRDAFGDRMFDRELRLEQQELFAA